jgi:pimeloyl-ACP methyl ester carboxylesterase
MREGWLERSGVRLHYLEWEPKAEPREPALFLLHGLSSNSLVWARMAAELASRRIVALDQRSHGLSDRPSEGYGSDELVGDAAHAIEELGLGRPLVGGHSWGASVALELAARRPDLASGLVFVDGPPASISRVMSWEEASVRMQPPFPIYASLEQAVEAQRQYLGEAAWDDDLQDFVRAGLFEVEGGLTSTLSVPVRLQILERMFHSDPPAHFPRVEGPVLLAMAGQLWPGAPSEFVESRQRAVEEVVAKRPDVQVRWYDSRHDIPLIQPGALAVDVERTATAAGFAALARETARLDGDWQRPVHGDGEGWAARDLLAHLASTQSSLAAVVTAQPRAEGGGEARPPFDPDRWNASQISRRREVPPADLLVELQRAGGALHAALMGVDLDRRVAIGPYGGRPVTEVMELMAAHQRQHLADLRTTLNQPG